MPLSHDLAQKSVQATIAAIEIYNKPDFHFREEAFSVLRRIGLTGWRDFFKLGVD